jgi:hypothetical protein
LEAGDGVAACCGSEAAGGRADCGAVPWLRTEATMAAPVKSAVSFDDTVGEEMVVGMVPAVDEVAAGGTARWLNQEKGTMESVRSVAGSLALSVGVSRVGVAGREEVVGVETGAGVVDLPSHS